MMLFCFDQYKTTEAIGALLLRSLRNERGKKVLFASIITKQPKQKMSIAPIHQPSNMHWSFASSSFDAIFIAKLHGLNDQNKF